MNRPIGTLLIAVSAASFGTLAIFGRFAYQDGMDTLTILFLRFGISALIMTMILLVRREQFPRGRILVQLIGMGALGYVGQSYSYLKAIQFASPGLVALLLYLYPFFVAILSMAFLHERLTTVRGLALAVAFIGTLLTVGPAGGQLAGVLLAVSAALIYSVYIIVGTDVMKHVSAVQSSTVIFASAGVVFGFLSLSQGAHYPSSHSGWLGLLGIILISTVIPVVTFLAGLERIGPTNAAMLSTLEPIVTVLLAAWLFGDKLHPMVLLGGGLILAAVVLLTRVEVIHQNLKLE